MISSIAKKISMRFARLRIPIGRWLRQRVRPAPGNLVKLGTAYGGWVFVEPVADSDRDCAILCGVGEDVSFDLAFQAAYGMRCILVDPTPRAIEHWRAVVESASGGVVAANQQSYDTEGVDFRQIEYRPFAVSDKEEDIKFWAPKNPEHVSYSVANIQESSEFMIVPAKTLASLSPVDSERVELVKLDVEGIGVRILDWVVDNKYFPRQILVEFEECFLPTRERFSALKRSVLALEREGYELVYFDGVANASFCRVGSHDARVTARVG